MKTARTLSIALVLALTGTLAAALSGSADAATKGPVYYVNLGDSYAAGYQYAGEPANLPLKGYANQAQAMLKVRHHAMRLVNFGCGGATTTSLMGSNGCPGYTPGGPTYPGKPQLAAALAFIAAHPGHIGLVTISIGGNDFDGCVADPAPVACVTAAMPGMKANVGAISAQLRTAAGPKVPIIATTYPDVVLGEWLHGSGGQSLASQSVQAFFLLINPNLKSGYTPHGVAFLDVTKASGAYIALSKTTTLAPYGTVPVAVAKVCTLTWYCAKGSIHPRTVGYTLMAKLITTQYLKMVKK